MILLLFLFFHVKNYKFNLLKLKIDRYFLIANSVESSYLQLYNNLLL
jgi:hypothetical protein